MTSTLFSLFWQGLEDLNPRHSVLETDVLPTELNPYNKKHYTKKAIFCQGVSVKNLIFFMLAVYSVQFIGLFNFFQKSY